EPCPASLAEPPASRSPAASTAPARSPGSEPPGGGQKLPDKAIQDEAAAEAEAGERGVRPENQRTSRRGPRGRAKPELAPSWRGTWRGTCVSGQERGQRVGS
ncbi:unnamed protein product, partial [Gulo gulo]